MSQSTIMPVTWSSILPEMRPISAKNGHIAAPEAIFPLRPTSLKWRQTTHPMIGNEYLKEFGHCWKCMNIVDSFARAQGMVTYSILEARNGSISAINFSKIPKGYLPHFSFIFHNPGPLGSKFKWNWVSKGWSSLIYQDGIRATYACINNTIEETNGMFQLNNNKIDCLFFDMWFYY